MSTETSVVRVEAKSNSQVPEVVAVNWYWLDAETDSDCIVTPLNTMEKVTEPSVELMMPLTVSPCLIGTLMV